MCAMTYKELYIVKESREESCYSIHCVHSSYPIATETWWWWWMLALPYFPFAHKHKSTPATIPCMAWIPCPFSFISSHLQQCSWSCVDIDASDALMAIICSHCFQWCTSSKCRPIVSMPLSINCVLRCHHNKDITCTINLTLVSVPRYNTSTSTMIKVWKLIRRSQFRGQA